MTRVERCATRYCVRGWLSWLSVESVRATRADIWQTIRPAPIAHILFVNVARDRCIA